MIYNLLHNEVVNERELQEYLREFQESLNRTYCGRKKKVKNPQVSYTINGEITSSPNPKQVEDYLVKIGSREKPVTRKK